MNQKFEQIARHQETFERVTERSGGRDIPVKYLYRRQYQNAKGEWQTIYYGIFTDWKGIRGS